MVVYSPVIEPADWALRCYADEFSDETGITEFARLDFPGDRPLLDQGERRTAGLLESGVHLLRAAPELLVMDPTPRSRLRWLPDAGEAAL